LLAEKVPESSTLEFKRDLPGRDNAARHEFIADVCAFANTASGGDIVYGIDEDDEGRAKASSATLVNADEEQRRLLDMAMNGLEPRVPGIVVRSIGIEGGQAFVVRVPGSWQAPHRARTNAHFYIREGARKRALDVPELRSAFLRTAGLASQIRDFRAERVGKILAGDSPVELANGPIGVLHLIPVQFSDPPAINPATISGKDLPLITSGGSTWRINLDGYMRFVPFDKGGSKGYTLLFRNGSVEAVATYHAPELERPSGSIPSGAMERYLLQFYDSVTPVLREMQIRPPWGVLFSLLRVKGAEFLAKSFDLIGGDGIFDRDVVLVPDVLIEDTRPGARALRPVLDMIWQAAGFHASPHYDDAGNRKERR
jgi:hypothetical protein